MRHGAAASGFSLIELMIVVTITGILAAIAIPSFSSYVYRSRTSEAPQFLGVIKLKQESFRSEFGQYLQYGAPAVDALDEIVFIPGDASTMDNCETFAFPDDDQWYNQLGARPDAPVRFGYGWAAGPPGTAPTALGFCGAAPCVPQDHWFAVQAVTDFDDDNNNFATFELSSVSRNVWVGDSSGNALAKGWE